jgi:hypothetical protein
VHGLSIPLGKLGFFLPRTLSRAFTSQGNSPAASFEIGDVSLRVSAGVLRERRRKRSPGTPGRTTPRSGSAAASTRHVYRIGGTVIRDRNADTNSPSPVETPIDRPATPPAVLAQRTIRFPDDNEVRVPKDR